MARNLIIFGNGLGRSLDNNFFDICTAMSSAWNENDCLDNTQKDLISECLPEGTSIPTCEEDLEKIYYAIIACEFLKTFSPVSQGEYHFLSDHGKNFLKAIKIYVTKVASYFYTYEGDLSESFTQPLIAHIKNTKSHVATLNYDDLLYTCFNNNGVFGERGNVFGTASLLDGITRSGFDVSHLERRPTRDFGWYLHLHGSPLFRTSGGVVKKLGRNELRNDMQSGVCNYSDHIVLSHVNHKPDYVKQSDILIAYWEFLGRAIEEANKITLFGYGGGDTHLNEFIRRKRTGTSIQIVKRTSGNEKDSDRYWEQKFGRDVCVVTVDNILDFTDWWLLNKFLAHTIILSYPHHHHKTICPTYAANHAAFFIYVIESCVVYNNHER